MAGEDCEREAALGSGSKIGADVADDVQQAGVASVVQRGTQRSSLRVALSATPVRPRGRHALMRDSSVGREEAVTERSEGKPAGLDCDERSTSSRSGSLCERVAASLPGGVVIVTGLTVEGP